MNVSLSPSVTVIPGERIQFAPPPAIPLGTNNPLQIFKLLEYAGVRYLSPDSEAAKQGIDVFQTARQFALETDRDAILFDWDHTVDNYQIFESILGLMRTRLSRSYPFKGEYPMTALESARPLMHELVMGLMVGYALRQKDGPRFLNEWGKYRPKVGLVTATWPDRLGILAGYIPLLSLMDGRYPGMSDAYENTVASKTFVHLHDCLSYAEQLLRDFNQRGFPGLQPHEQDAVIAYLRQGKAHYIKPLGAIREKWGMGALMLFDDDPDVYQFYLQGSVIDSVLAVFVPNPWTDQDHKPGEFDKLAFGLTREGRILNATRAIQRAESRTPVPSLMKLLERLKRGGRALAFEDRTLELSRTGEGTVLQLPETGTTLRRFHADYVERGNRVKRLIAEVIERVGGGGGMHWIESTYRDAVARRQPARS